MNVDFEPFVPLFRHADIQTVAGRFWPAHFDTVRWPGEERLFQTESEVQVLGHLHRGGEGPERPLIVAVHGLASSNDAPYIRRLAQAALEAGFDVLRLNVRNCGGTEHLSPTLYHSGLTADLRSVVEQLAPTPLCIAGFSMGGNMALKLAGEWGGSPPNHVRAVCGVSVPIRLGPCARRLAERRNRIYELRFLRTLRRDVRRKQQLLPERFRDYRLDGVRSIYDFDQVVTAPHFGFKDADDYYDYASSAGYLNEIRVPALLIHAEDDPFIPFETYQDPVFDTNSYLRLLTTSQGGHVAFLARRPNRFWILRQILRFFEAGE